jgi:hypothetical protein
MQDELKRLSLAWSRGSRLDVSEVKVPRIREIAWEEKPASLRDLVFSSENHVARAICSPTSSRWQAPVGTKVSSPM